MSEETKDLVTRIKEDKELYEAWVANIAMAFKDEWDRRPRCYKTRKEVSEIANTAARNFLDTLTRRTV